MGNPEGKALTAPAAPANLALLPKDLTADLVVRYINKNANSQEIMFFLQQCAAFNLNPFKREIFLIKYNSDEPGQIVIAYQTFIARAERSLRLKGWRTWVDYGQDDIAQAKSPIRAHIEIFRADWDKPFVHSVRFSEYIGHKRDGSVTKMWKEKEETMIRKVVTTQGFRLCFPDELGDLPFTTEELGQDEPDHNAPQGAMPTIKAEAYVKPKSEEAAKPKEAKVIEAEIVKPDTPKAQEASPEAEDPGPEAPVEPPSPAPKAEEKPAKPAAAKKPAPAQAAPAKPAPAAKPTQAKSGVAPTDLKERILSLMAILEKDFGKDPAAMFTAIMGRIQAIFKRTPENFPDDLTALEAAKVLEILERTVRSEEIKKAEAPAAPEEPLS
jgi:phage recombination protein Bet